MTDPAPAPQAVPSRRRGELTLPPLPQLAEVQAELSRLEIVEVSEAGERRTYARLDEKGPETFLVEPRSHTTWKS